MQLVYQHRFEGVVWSTLISNDNESLILDVRNENDRSITYYGLNLEDHQLNTIETANASWWSTMEAYDQSLFLSEYQDKSDPNHKKYYKLNGNEKEEVSYQDLPYINHEVIQPNVYEPGSDYFRTVADFLGLELPCACEYLEIDRKIIMSYYLRSGKELARYLLLLEGGEKLFKELQDAQMKGFASGSFFVVNGRLIFIKNRNEIVVYTV